jgi:hypothetical protein
MSRSVVYAGLAAAALLVGSQKAYAQADDANSAQSSTATTSAPDVSVTSSTTSPVAFNPSADAANAKKPFTISAEIREEYDDNIYTAHNDKISSYNTIFTPSFLFDYPMATSDFSARYTFGATYYTDRPGSKFDFTHEFVAHFTHSFSDRFNLDLREKFGYYTEPDVTDGYGTIFRDGSYIDNLSTAQLTAQWTPIFSTTSTFTNNLVSYDAASIAAEQNNMENTGAEDFNFAVQPTVTAVIGGIVDDISYDHINRGYRTYTGSAGILWAALPTLDLGFHGGGSYTETTGAGTQVTPYGNVTANWRFGAKSTLVFDYTHSVVPTDIVYASGQVADRVTTTLNYNATPNITTHLTGAFTHGEYTQNLLAPGSLSSFNEDVLGVDVGGTYHFDNMFDLNLGYIYTDVSSQIDFRDYTRNQVYVGVRGTY